MTSRSTIALACSALVLSASTAHAQVSKPFPGMTLVEHGAQGSMIVLDLCAPGTSIKTTAYADRKATPEQWASPKGYEAATNADFFDFPGWTYVIGRARSAGQDWPATAQAKEGRPYWQFGPGVVEGLADGATAPKAAATEIFGGHNVIISGGKTTGPWAPANDGALLNTLHARTAFGISADRRTVFSLAVPDAVTAQTVVDRMFAWSSEAKAPAVDYATNLDGGGSSQMYVKGRGQIVTSGRQVNNHVGLLAKGGTTVSPMCLPRFAAVFKSQSFPPASAPMNMKVGDVVDAYIELTNTGTATWTPGVTKLAPTPRDKPSDAGGVAVGWPAANRAATVTKPVKPGEVGRFSFKLAPTRAGDWVQTFGLVEEGLIWFADPTLGGGPSDTQLAVHLVVTGNGSGASDDGGLASGEGGAGGEAPGATPNSDGNDAAATDEGCSVPASGRPTDFVSLGLVLGAGLLARRRRRSWQQTR
ncbi:MAG: hypothetical protein JWM74_5438 [Myxococcaceae bacterium]|nr:hypothetical protein [Myxococcaceae bacterium]